MPNVDRFHVAVRDWGTPKGFAQSGPFHISSHSQRKMNRHAEPYDIHTFTEPTYEGVNYL